MIKTGQLFLKKMILRKINTFVCNKSHESNRLFCGVLPAKVQIFFKQESTKDLVIVQH